MEREWIDGRALGLGCMCGSSTFSRVVVERIANRPIVTDFVACIECKAMFWMPTPSTLRGPFDYAKAYQHLKRKPGEKW